MYRSLAISTFVLFSFAGNALEIQKIQAVNNGEVFYSLYGDDDKFFVSALLEQKGLLPVQLWKRTFNDVNQARTLFNQQPGRNLDFLTKSLFERQAIEVEDVELWTV